ncbi:hypothetical protein E2C01_063088 [Portunus trituberculatus]|uniref:Uncharacterized protein n=1 Tax=Portunus trituberculatus TaxID=210409 RepID=A0A5B7HJC3_PORTR|nr:hypothetical protein [Portunus trituberculatus]
MSRAIRRPRGHWCQTPPRYPSDLKEPAPNPARRRTTFATLKTHLYRRYLQTKGGAHGERQMPKNTNDCQKKRRLKKQTQMCKHFHKGISDRLQHNGVLGHAYLAHSTTILTKTKSNII